MREIVLENRQQQSLDAQFNDLVNSDTFVKTAEDMKSIKTTIDNLRDFLSEHGVQGAQA